MVGTSSLIATSECIISNETCFSETVLMLLSHGVSTISSSKQLLSSFSLDFFPYQLDLSLHTFQK